MWPAEPMGAARRALFRASVAAVAAVVAGGAVAAQRGAPRADETGGIRFENVTRRSGVEFTLVSGTPSKMFLVESTGGGVALVDIDNDGWLDLYMVNGSTLEDERRGRRRAPNRLFRNRGDGTFVDVTEHAGVGGRHWGMGVCAGDVNSDGFTDLYVTTVGPDILFLNNGNGSFRDASADAGVQDRLWSSSCAFADYDGDGDLDLYVSNYIQLDFARPPDRANDGLPCGYRGLLVACGPLGLTPVPDVFYENVGGGRFRDVTGRAGLGGVAPSFGMGVVWGDYDDDGDQDIYVANDEMPNFLFRNNGNKTFTEVAVPAGVAVSGDGMPQGSMGVDFGDADNDGDLDLFVTNFTEQYNTLYRNEGNGTFTDATRASGMLAISLPYVGWGVFFSDLDLDGLLDLPVANGHLYPQLDQVAPQRADLFSNATDSFGRSPAANGQGYRQRNLLFRNLGKLRFAEIGERAGSGFRQRDALSSRGLAAGDLDNDGLVDLVMTSLDEPPSVLLNRSAGRNWLLVSLRGAANRPIVGAKVTVRTGTLVQRRDLKSGGSYQSHGDMRAHFGLGGSATVDELTVRWPSGTTTVQRNVSANQVLVVTEG